MKRQILDKDFWQMKRQVVRLSYVYNEHWAEIIDKFKVRVVDFYFKPIDRVKEPNDLKGEGFSILTIQGALIEMFAAFKFGKVHKFNKNGNDPNYTYKKADDCFIPFLQTETIFENHFYKTINGNKIVNEPFSAMDFYNKVRCGLMHEARTKGEWHVNAKKIYEGNETTFISVDTTSNRISIDRNILNRQLRKYFDGYITNLRQETIEASALRRLFARKLDHLYDLPIDMINFDWWNDD